MMLIGIYRLAAPLLSSLLLFCYCCEAFPVIPTNQPQQRIPTFVSLQKEQTYYNDFDEFWPLPQEKEEKEDEWKDWLSELQARQEELTKQNISIEKNISTKDDELSIQRNWKDASCTSTIRLALPNDWIRRVAIQYPLAVVGGCSGSLYLADLDTGNVLDVEEEVHDSYEDVEFEDQEEAIRKLYGDYDGGGIIGLTFHQDYVYSSGREGGFHVCQLLSSDNNEKKGNSDGTTTLRLVPQGRHLEGTTLITSFATDSQHVWAAGYNGILYGYPHAKTDVEEEYRINENGEIVMGGVEMIQLDVQSPILHVTVEEELGLGVCSTLDGKVHLFSLQHGTLIEDWIVFSTWAKQQNQLDYARCVTFVQLNDHDSWCVVVGGSRGQLYSRLLSPSTGKFGNVVEKLKPHHAGPVMCMTSPHPNVLVTGAQDGTMRVWDIPTCLYALTGYKVWLGSIVTDGTRLLSDGADNTIVLHDFSNNNKDNQSSNLLDDIALEDDDDDYTLD